MKKYEVAVIFGGISNENEISVITGTMACNILKKEGKTVLPVYISTDGEIFAGEELADIAAFKDGSYSRSKTAAFVRGGAVLLNAKGKVKERAQIDCALNCCHGGDGEGGGVSGLFAVNGVPFASAGIFESSAFMDKYLTKLVLSALGVNTAPYRYARSKEQGEEIVGELGFPVMVKPCKLGSSIGVAKAEDGEELSSALETAFALDDGVILEKYYSDRREINCAAYFGGGEVITSECEEAFTGGDFLSFDDKYAGGGKRVCPADIPELTAKTIKNITSSVYSSLNMRGIVRFDYILSGGEIVLSEINTVPGSLSYYLLSDGFKNFYSVLDKVIAQAKADFAAKSGKLVSKTGILNNLNTNACKIK